MHASFPISVFACLDLQQSAYTMCICFRRQNSQSTCRLQWHSTTQKYLSCTLQDKNGILWKGLSYTISLPDGHVMENRIYKATLAGICTQTLLTQQWNCRSLPLEGGWKTFYLKVRITRLDIRSVNRFKHFSLPAFGSGWWGYNYNSFKL